VGYKYPHDFPGHYVAQDYLPEELAGEHFYEPGEEGAEKELVAHWRALRQKGEKSGPQGTAQGEG
jgi:putative ATPase